MAQTGGGTAVGRGTLVLAGSPLGNAQDASPRLAALLVSADLVAAEDTRRLRRLLADLGVSRDQPVISFYEGVELARMPRVLSALAEGAVVALITDAGMPSVSDPGFRAARAAIDAGHRVTCLPGPSAVTTALAVSGLPCERFCFEGFLPRGGGARRGRLDELSGETRTQVLFESPHRLAATLADMAAAFGADRPAAVCRELSKTYEEVRRGSLSELVQWAGAGVRGEITIVVAGAEPPDPGDADPSDLAAAVAALEAAGSDRKSSMAAVARSWGVPKRVVYDAVVRGT